MRNYLFLTTISFLVSATLIHGQTNFRTGWEAANPVAEGSDIPIEEKLSTHLIFLAKAQLEENTLQEVYAHLYLAYDYLYLQNYVSATEQLLKADSLTNRAGNPGWQGWVMHRKAIVSLRTKNYEDALQEYKESARLCGEAKDSLCLAESLEQVSVMYGYLKDFENARHWNEIAMPLIEKFGGEAQLASSLNNFGTILKWKNHNAEAVPYFERSIALYQKLGKQLQTVQVMNNLAGTFNPLHQYEKAEKTLKECIRINRENNFQENLRTNYGNLCVLYDSMGDYRRAFEYLDKYYSLNDSLIGAETQREIAELQIKYETQQKELELEKSKATLKTAHQTIERLVLLVLLVIVMAATGIWRWRWLNQQAKREILKNKETLADLTRILLEKNRQLTAQKNPAPQEPDEDIESEIPTDLDENLFELNILTDADWTSFKAYFEKAYPGYLLRLRSKYPDLTDAEERLFLFIKLNLTTKEIAAILGIAVASVKKTRYRLRKRLGLGEDVDLQEFILSF